MEEKKKIKVSKKVQTILIIIIVIVIYFISPFIYQEGLYIISPDMARDSYVKKLIKSATMKNFFNPMENNTGKLDRVSYDGINTMELKLIMKNYKKGYINPAQIFLLEKNLKEGLIKKMKQNEKYNKTFKVFFEKYNLNMKFKMYDIDYNFILEVLLTPKDFK